MVLQAFSTCPLSRNWYSTCHLNIGYYDIKVIFSHSTPLQLGNWRPCWWTGVNFLQTLDICYRSKSWGRDDHLCTICFWIVYLHTNVFIIPAELHCLVVLFLLFIIGKQNVNHNISFLYSTGFEPLLAFLYPSCRILLACFYCCFFTPSWQHKGFEQHTSIIIIC